MYIAARSGKILENRATGQVFSFFQVSVVPQESLHRFQGLSTPAAEPTDGATSGVNGFVNPLDPGIVPLPHFSEHYENVKRCHLRLHDTMQAMGGADPNTASRSILRSNLR